MELSLLFDKWRNFYRKFRNPQNFDILLHIEQEDRNQSYISQKTIILANYQQKLQIYRFILLNDASWVSTLLKGLFTNKNTSKGHVTRQGHFWGPYPPYWGHEAW